MTLNEWEQSNIEILTSRKMGEWLGRRENRLLEQIRAEIEELDRYYDNDYFSTNNCPMYKCNEVLLIIDKYNAERMGE